MKLPTWVKFKEITSYFVGLGGLLYEAIARHPPDYGILPVFVGLLGLPVLTRKTKPKTGPGGNDPADPPADEDDGTES